ncbi:S8 family serine peptidase [Actinoallomurus sp. NBC_01490]|uniref:S8 family serine peptidase n=1 Tax=Actinoallomurus sp. NBC_01490 TaxID=2903557 RepID=UPI002E303395|nr:S8 family serine peptidase [Actinoallomurus sp. NBC_01490]
MRGLLAAAAALALTALSASPAGAVTPRPRADEWWFAPWAISDIWKVTRGAGVTVAVLDSGVNARLPELAGAVLPGGDTTGQNTDGRTDFDKKNDGHGTAMSALIVGQGGGRSGFAGVAPEAKLLPIRVSHSAGPIDSEQVFSAGIRYATDHGAKVINISLAADADQEIDECPTLVKRAIADAIQHDVVIVAAAGDEGDAANAPEYPASCPGVLAVGAIDKYAEPWKSTQRQSYVTVAAPGVHVGWVGQSGKYYPNGWGSSQASALTAGGVALIRSANPRMSAREVVQRITATAKDVGDPGRDSATGYGVIRIYHAMMKNEYPVAASEPNPVFERFDAWQARNGGRPTAAPTPPAASGKQAGAGRAGRIAIVAVLAFVCVLLVSYFRSSHRKEAERRRSQSSSGDPVTDAQTSHPPTAPTGDPSPHVGRPQFLPPDETNGR